MFDLVKYLAADGVTLSKDLGIALALTSKFSNIPSLPKTRGVDIAIQKKLKAYYTSKFEYSENDEVDAFLIEEMLFTYGECAVIIYKGVFVVGKPIIKEYDYNGFPFKIKLVPLIKAGAKAPQPLDGIFTVGEDAVLIRDDRGILANTGYMYSPWMIILDYLKMLAMVRDQILKNVVSGRTIIKVPSTANSKIIQDLERWLWSGKPVLPMKTDADGVQGRIDMEPMQIEDRTINLINNYHFIMDQLKEALGAESNATPNKPERQINQEINMNNVISEGVTHTKLLMRQRGMRMLERVFGITMTVKLREPVLPPQRPQAQTTPGAKE